MSHIQAVKPCPKYHTCLRCQTVFYKSAVNLRSAAKMAGNLPTEFGLLPWTNDQYELQFKEFPEIFSNQISSTGIKWKIVYPETPVDPAPKFELERTVTSFIRYYADKGNYSSVFWLGADNIGVTLHYMHQLAVDCKISLKKNESPRSIKSIVTDVFNYIESECTISGSEHDRVLVIYSCAEHYEVRDSLQEIEPFVPEEDYSRIDFMILTSNPSNFDMVKPESSAKVSCRLKSTVASFQIQTCSERTTEMYRKLLETAEDSEKKDIEKVLLLVSLLYPNNMTHAFIEAAIEYIAGETEEEVLEEEVESGWEEGSTTGSKAASEYSEGSGSNPADGMLNALKALIKAFVLRRTGYTGSMEVLCIDRRFQDESRTKAKEADGVKMMEMVENLQNFIGGAFPYSGNGNPLQNLFKRYKDEDDGFLGSEAAMHMFWLQTTSAKGILEIMSGTLLENVKEYVNLFFVGKIAMFHRQKPLGRGNNPVFAGYTYEPHHGKTLIAVKRLHGGDQKKIKREIEKLAKVQDNHVVGYKFSETALEYTYLALEKCDETLEEWVKKRGPRDLSEDLEELALRFKLLRDVTKGLKCINDNGVVHRDIKPSNILLKIDGTMVTAKIADFDLSKFLGATGSASASSKTHGSEGYMAPEAKRPNAKTHHETDMYSFGKVCYFVLSSGGKTKISPEKITFKFDFYGVAETIRKLLSPKRSDRMTAEDLLKYPMFWICEDRDKFANFIVNFFMKHGKKGLLHDKLVAETLAWDLILTRAYQNLDVEAVIDYRPPTKKNSIVINYGPISAKRPKNNYDGNIAGFLRFCRNAIEHAKEHKEEANLQFVDQHYFDHERGQPDFWKFFKTYFSPCSEVFFKVWNLAREEPGISVVALSEIEPQLDMELMDYE